MEAEKLLTICIPTYNRRRYLEATLNYLADSPFRNCPTVVINDASPDDTKIVESEYPHVEWIDNKFNVGYCNLLRCAEYVATPYLWIIGDDDQYDFSHVEDVVEIMKEGKVELIHVGAHTDKPWIHGGVITTPREAHSKGYNYFRYASFMGCNIYKTATFIKYVREGYNNVVNSYPHMPCLHSFWEEDKPIYISKNQIAKAIIGNQSYSFDQCWGWWGNSCRLLKSKKDQQLAFFDQFYGLSLKHILFVRYSRFNKKISKKTYRVHQSFTPRHLRLLSFILFPAYWIARLFHLT